MTINLCLASRLFYPYYAGGALRYMRYLPGLAERKIQVQVFTGTPSIQRAKAFKTENTWENTPVGELLPVSKVNNTPVHRIRLPDDNERRRDLIFGNRLLQFVNCASPDIDLIQFLPLPLWLTPALLRLKRRNIPLVSTYNLLDSKETSKYNLATFSRRLPQQLVDLIIVQSATMRDGLQQIGVTTPIEVIPNGVDLKQFKPVASTDAKNNLKKQLGFAENDLLLLMVGSVEPRKGTDQLVAAWNTLATEYDNVHLLLVGPRPDLENPKYEKFHDELERLLDQSGNRARVHFLGKVENAADFYRVADIFVFASRREGFPNVILEAMASRLPVVTMPFLGLSEELGKAGEHFLLVERDPVQFGTAVKNLIHNPEKRQQLGVAGCNWVKSMMDLNHILDRYADVYQQVYSRNN